MVEGIRIQLKCDQGPRKLLGVMIATGQPVKVEGGRLMELPCPYCRGEAHKIYGKKPLRVLHYFNVVGELVESAVQWG